MNSRELPLLEKTPSTVRETLTMSKAAAPVADVRFGSKTEMAACHWHVRFIPNSAHSPKRVAGPLCAKTGQSVMLAKSMFLKTTQSTLHSLL
jgi:hypothetical protein